MNITFVSDTYAPQVNGVARTLERLVRGLRQRGHDVDVICPDMVGAGEDGMRVASLPLPGYDGIHIGFSPRSEFHNRWSQKRPDIIYVATETPLGISAIETARGLQIPVVSGFHTNFQQYLSYYNLPGLEPIATLYLKLVHNRSLRTYVPCDDVRRALRREGFDNLALLPKGVDTRHFGPARRSADLRAEWGVSDDETVGIHVGRVAPEKNLPLVIKAFARMKELNPKFRAIFVGDGPKRADLERENPDILFVGARYGEELAEYYASADIFVFPSMTETFGNVVLEAMASGLVTISYDYAAAGQHIQHGVNGFKALFGDEEEFMKCCELAMDQRHWDDVKENGRAEAVSVSWDRVIDDFQDSLTDVIRDHARDAFPGQLLHYF